MEVEYAAILAVAGTAIRDRVQEPDDWLGIEAVQAFLKIFNSYQRSPSDVERYLDRLIDQFPCSYSYVYTFTNPFSWEPWREYHGSTTDNDEALFNYKTKQLYM